MSSAIIINFLIVNQNLKNVFISFLIENHISLSQVHTCRKLVYANLGLKTPFGLSSTIISVHIIQTTVLEKDFENTKQEKNIITSSLT